MKGIDIHVQHIIVFINYADRLLQVAVHLYFLQTAILAYTMIYMGNIVSGLQLAKSTQRDRLPLGLCLLYFVFVVALKYLVIGIAYHFLIVVYKTFADSCRHRHETDTRIQVLEYATQPFQLLRILRENE